LVFLGNARLAMGPSIAREVGQAHRPVFKEIDMASNENRNSQQGQAQNSDATMPSGACDRVPGACVDGQH
jgi:hypothetical protein